MALNFFRQRDIDKMDANDIPEEFINYFETLDDNSKASLVGSRPDLAEALGFVLPKIGEESYNDLQETKPETNDINEEKNEYDSIASEMIQDTTVIEEGIIDDLAQIRRNLYEGVDLDEFVKDDMPELEALAIPSGTTVCMLHRSPLEKKQIKFRSSDHMPTFGIILKMCRACHRVYLEELKMSWIHDGLAARGIPHTFYDLDLTSKYLKTQIQPYKFATEDTLQIPDTWVEEDPRCPIHDEVLYDVPCFKKYKDREIRFVSYKCDRCGKYLMRRASALNLLDKCAEAGIPQIRIERLAKKIPPKKPVLPKKIWSDYLIENGQRVKYRYDVTEKCYQLFEDDIIVVSDSIYCVISGHDSIEEVVAMIGVLQKKGGRMSYLFHLGYCPDCQKYYMAEEDYKVLYKIGRPAATILYDIDDNNYQITSGEVFNLERNHLGKVEKKISDEITSIKNSPDYVNPYATGDYDDGNLAYAKGYSQQKYGGRLSQLSDYAPKPYSYRVDISLKGVTETYYVGAADIFLDGKQQVISANSDFGHNLVNYQTTKIKKGGKEYGIRLSRQFDINNARLFGYINLRTDEDEIFKSGITDPFLVRVLNMRKRQHNLTDIFVTIQENQNQIVNTPFSKNIIVQGCAGSGKTMVLLHRLSSLQYKEKSFDFSEHAMILTPHDQFSLHIKGLAEELQIGSIQRVSVEQYYIDMLYRYSPEFKLQGKVSSEMIVRQSFVDYIYSDQFLESFKNAYSTVLEERNSLAVRLKELQKTIMGQDGRDIDRSDDSKVVQQMKFAVNALDNLIKQRKLEVREAENEYKKHIRRKRFLQEKVKSLEESFPRMIKESLPRVYTKIGTYLSECQHKISELQEEIARLKIEKYNTQKSRFLFGKQRRLNDIERLIIIAERNLDSENRKQDEELLILSQSTDELNNDEVLAWMTQVMRIVPDVKEEVKLCNNIWDEKQKFTDELIDIDSLIEKANKNTVEKKAALYSDNVEEEIRHLFSELNRYSVLGTYEMVFDRAVQTFKEANNIKNISGKYHRYDLYARLLFAMQYYGKTLGTTQFICIDEGQDLAYNEYRLLYELNQRHIVFNVFGDTNQLMKQGRGISDWAVLKKLFKAESFSLNENYRNTNQITRFCNSSFNMKVTQTGVDGVNVREIPRKDLETELAALNVTSERIAILVPRGVQKSKYLKNDLLPSSLITIIGDKMDNGFISLMYVDEVKGIEFEKAFVITNKMSRNEKYIAYTRALSELILVIDEQVG